MRMSQPRVQSSQGKRQFGGQAGELSQVCASDTIIRSEECKAHAAECLALAQTAASGEQKKILFELAGEWEAMAQQAERLEQQLLDDRQVPQGRPGCCPARQAHR